MAVHPRICVSGISTWDWTLDQDLAFYAEAGIHTVGVALRKLALEDADTWVDRIDTAGLRVANVIGVGPFRLHDPSSWDEQRRRALAAVEVADRLDAECLVLTTGPAGPLEWEDAADAFAAAIDPVADRAQELDLPIALEHTNSLRVDVGFVHTLRDAIDLARRLDLDVCAEVNACWAERDLAATIREGIDRVRLVQVSDFRIGTRTTPDRLVPGDGDIPLARILDQLIDAGYDGVFDLELIGPAIEAEGYPSVLRRSVEALGRLLP